MTLHQLAKKYEAEIKGAIIQGSKDYFPSPNYPDLEDGPDMLTLLTRFEDGVYLSEIFASCLCCLVVSKKSGYLYQVSASIDEKHEELDNFISAVVA